MFLSAYPSFYPSWWVVGCGCHPGSLRDTERSVAHVHLVKSSETQAGYLEPPGKERKKYTSLYWLSFNLSVATFLAAL